MTYPIAWIRDQFPALKRGGAVYLDNAAGAQVPQQVVSNMVEALTTMQVNKGGAYAQSARIGAAKEKVREDVATFLNASSPENVAFGPNATTLLELLAQAFGRRLAPGDEIVVTELDHHANVDPWRRLKERGFTLKTWPTRAPHHTLELEDLEPLLSDKTRLVAMTAASNALGTLAPVVAAAERVHAAGAHLMVDTVHYSPHFLPDVARLGADALVFSPYKVFGPHAGVLYLGDELRSTLAGPGLAFFEQEKPINWEPGTQNHEAIYAFGGVFDYLDEVADRLGTQGTRRERWQKVYEAFHAHETALFEKMLTGLDDLGVTRYGLPGTDGRTATVSLNVGEHAPRTVAEHLGERGVAAADGHYYAYDLMMDAVGLRGREGAVRLSLLHYNDVSDVDAVLAALGEL